MAPCETSLSDLPIKIDVNRRNSDSTASSEESNRKKSSRTRQNISTFIVTLAACCSGTFLSWTSSALPLLISENSKIQIDQYEGSWLTSLLNLGAFFGAVPAVLMAEKFGRKDILLSLALPMIVSWLLMAFSTSVYCFYVGRFVGGVAVGAICVAVPTYVAETTMPEVRNSLGSFYQLQLVSGIFYGLIAGLVENVIILSLVCAIVPVLYFVCFLLMPDSPVYLMTQGKITEARNSLRYIRGKECDVEDELSRIRGYIEDCISDEGQLKDLITSKSNFKALIIAIYLMIFQQMSGITPIIFYMQNILLAFEVEISSSLSSIIVGAIVVVIVATSCPILYNTKRRPMLIFTSAIMAFSITSMGIFYHLGYASKVKYDWVPILCLSIYLSMYFIGFGSVSWVVLNEIFPTNVRRQAMAICVGLNWSVAFFVAKYYQSMIMSVGVGWVLCNFGCSCAIATMIGYFLLPETKGKTMEEIHKELDGDSALRIKYVIEIDNISSSS